MATAISWRAVLYGTQLCGRNRFGFRSISELIQSNGKRLFLVDTLALVRRLEAQDVPTKQAEAITAALIEVLNDSLENVSYSFVSKAEMQKNEMKQESNLGKFKSEVESNLGKFKSEVKSSQENHFSLQQHQTEKLKSDTENITGKLKSDIENMTGKLKSDIENMRCELRYEMDKVTAGQRLDLNLEKGRIRDELNNQNQQTISLTNKLDREIHELRAQVEAAKYDVIKYCIGTLASISAVGLAVIRILL